MANVKVEIDFNDAVKQQCAELRSSYRASSSNEDVTGWIYKLLDCFSYSDMAEILVEVIDKSGDSFKNNFIEKIASDKITKMQEEYELLKAKIKISELLSPSLNETADKVTKIEREIDQLKEQILESKTKYTGMI